MPPKSAKAAAAAKDVQETEDPLQAVVLADSFETRFSPLTIDTPRCLLPLANVPLIEYTFSFLAGSGVEQVFLYCGAHTAKIEEYVHKSKWTTPASPFQLEVIRSTSRSIGDAMRDLDKRALLSNDFLVVYGDVVCNMTMDKVLAEHRARRATDKNAIMTMVLREAGTAHRTKAADMAPTFVIDPARQRCLHYEQVQHAQSHVELDADVLAQDVDVRTDLIDCGIDICTPDVLALWSDNFDYEAPRRGFLHSVLKDYELNGKTIHTYIVDGDYAARVRDLAAYDSISKDVISGWSYPLGPESNLYGDFSYCRSKNNVFREDSVRISKMAHVGPNSVLGRGSQVGADSFVRNSVIGRNCSIGRHCLIEDAYLWEDVVVEDGAEVRKAIIASKTTIGKQSKISNGTLVASGLRLAEGTRVGKGERATGKRKRDQQAEPAQQSEYEIMDSEEYEQHTTGTGLAHSLASLRVSASQESISTLNSEASDDEDVPVHRGSFVSVGSDDSRHSVAGENFVHDAANSIQDSLKQGHDISTIQLELQGLRMAANASEHQVRRAVVGGLMKHVAESQKAGMPAKTILAKSKTLVERTVFDAASDDKPDQVDFLLLTQADMAKRTGGEALFLAVCNGLYLVDDFEDGLFDTEAFEQWWNDAKSQSSDEMKKVRARAEEFIHAIADDEDDDDDDDDDEDESD